MTLTWGQVCSCATDLHADEDNLVNYVWLAYCAVDAKGDTSGMVVAAGLLVAWLGLNFYLLAVAADE